MVGFGRVRCGKARFGEGVNGAFRNHTSVARSGRVRFGRAWRGLVGSGMARYGQAWLGAVRSGMVWEPMAHAIIFRLWLGQARPGVVRRGEARYGWVWHG